MNINSFASNSDEDAAKHQDQFEKNKKTKKQKQKKQKTKKNNICVNVL